LDTPDLEKLKQDDADEWARAWEWAKGTALSVAHKKLTGKHRNQAEDIALEAFGKVHKRIHDITTSDGIKPYLAKITDNQCADYYKKELAQKRGSGKTLSLDQLRELTGDLFTGFQFPEDFQRRDLFQLIKGYVKKLETKQKLVLEGYFLDGLSYKEIAEKHAIKVGSIGVYKNRGLENLRIILPELGGSTPAPAPVPTRPTFPALPGVPTPALAPLPAALPGELAEAPQPVSVEIGGAPDKVELILAVIAFLLAVINLLLWIRL